MRVCRIAAATALFGMMAGVCSDASSASLRVGITIVETCRVETHGHGAPMGPVRAGCWTDTPFSVDLDGRPLRDDGRSRPAAVPGDAVSAAGAAPRRRIATFTF